jgi:hypothetical protein
MNQATPQQPKGISREITPEVDPRVRHLNEWAEVQALSESLAAAGAHRRSMLPVPVVSAKSKL